MERHLPMACPTSSETDKYGRCKYQKTGEKSIFKLLTDYCPPYPRVTARDESVPALEAPAGDVALLTAVRRILEAGLEDLLRVGIGWQFKLEVFIPSERVNELVLLLGGLHSGIWLCGFNILNRWTMK